MQNVTAPATPIVRFELDKRCKSCIVLRYLMVDVGGWTYEFHGAAAPAGTEENAGFGDRVRGPFPHTR